MEVVKCHKCGCVVTDDPKQVTEGYKYYCPNCDEDLYGIETYKCERKVKFLVSAVLSRVVEVDAENFEAASKKLAQMLKDGEVSLSLADMDERGLSHSYYGFADTEINK